MVNLDSINNLIDSSHSTILSNSNKILLPNCNKSTNINTKPSINFIERNKQLLSNKLGYKNSNSLSLNNNEKNLKSNHNKSDSDIIIKYLNDIQPKNSVTKKTELKTNQNIDVNCDGVNDISIISSHSSIRSSALNVDIKLKKNNQNEEKENLISRNDQTQQIENEIEPVAFTIAISNEQEQTPLIEILNAKTKLVQGDQQANFIEDVDDFFSSQNQIENDVNILKSDNERSKARSIFLQRFGDVLPKRRQVIPNLIETNEVNSLNSNDITTPQYPTTDYSSESVSSAWQYQQCINNNNNKKNNRYSINENKSLPETLNAVSQPLARMHIDLENKINNVLKELEYLRENDKTLSRKLELRKKIQESNENLSKSEESMDELVEIKQKKQRNSEIELRMKYLEKLQENQVMNSSFFLIKIILL